MKLMLYEHCKIVRGAKHTVLQDNLRGTIHRIPVEVADYFEAAEKTKLSAFQVQEIETYLIEEELAFSTNTPVNFIKSDNKIFSPFKLEYCILEYSTHNMIWLEKLFEELNALRCQHLEFRCYEVIELTILQTIIEAAIKAQFRSIDIYYQYNEREAFEDYTALIRETPLINYWVVHSTPKAKL